MHTTAIDSWLFRRGDDPRAADKRADESGFRRVRVPHDWSVEEPFDPTCSSGTGYLPGGVGWYRTRCSIRGLGAERAAAVELVFHGVYKNAEVWANGYHLGGRPSGYAEFCYDLTEIVAYSTDDDLVISVRVEHSDLADSRWYNGAGITRRVDIEVHDAVSPARHGTTVTTRSADQDRASVGIAQLLRNHTDTAQPVVVEQVVQPWDSGNAGTPASAPIVLAPHRITVPARGTVALSLDVDVRRPRLWSDDHPFLYRLVSVITQPDRTGPGVRHEQVFGIRTFDFHPDHGFRINGEPRTLKGVCLHEDAGCLGTAVPAEVWLRRLLTLKQGGCNAVRMAHNPHAPELYELCDLVGLYVIDEAFDEWENPKNKWWQGHNVYPPKHDGPARDFPQWHVRDLEAMVDAHRHHPSVIAWSIGNEIDYPNDPYASPLFTEMTGNNDWAKPAAERLYDPSRPDIRRLTTIAAELRDIVVARDPSRPVTLAAAFPELSSRTGLLDGLGLIGYNYKEPLYAEDHVRFPDQPFVGSETSHDYADWRHVADQDFVAGQFLWTGIDYLGETPGWPSHGSAAGLLTTAGFDKPLWHLRRSWWCDEPVLSLTVHPGDAEPNLRQPALTVWQPGDRLSVVCCTNVTELEVSHGGQPVDMSFDPEAGYWRGALAAAGAPITAAGRRGAATVRTEVSPAGAPAALRAVVWEAPAPWRDGLDRIERGRGDLFQVECLLVDADGRPANGDAEVSVAVTGGELIGLDNGNLSDPTPYRAERRLTRDARLIGYVRGFGATVTLQATDLAGVVVRTAPERAGAAQPRDGRPHPATDRARAGSGPGGR